MILCAQARGQADRPPDQSQVQPARLVSCIVPIMGMHAEPSKGSKSAAAALQSWQQT